MLPSLALAAALLAPAAPMPKDTTPNPTGPAPQVIYLSATQNIRGIGGVAPANAARPAAAKEGINLITYTTKKVQMQVPKRVNGKIEFEKKEVDQRMPTSKLLGERGEVFTTIDGSKLTAEEAVRRLSAGAVALISMDGKPVDAGWLRVMDKDIITIHSTEITSQVASYNRGVKTPAPRLAFLTPDADGVIRIAMADPQELPGVGNVVIAGNGGAVVQARIQINGGAVLPIQVDNGGAAAAPGKKGEKLPLDKINFEAYTARGESVSKEDALKRLKAGGIVAIAGSNQKPDEAFMKSFTPDLLVLVAQELVHGGGGTSSVIGGFGGVGGIARPLPIQIQALPAQIAPANPVPAKPADPNAKPADGDKPVEARPVPAVKPIRAPVPIRALPVKPAGGTLPIVPEKAEPELPKS